MSTYKQQKEDFVSNLTGGTVGEIVLVSVVGYVRKTQSRFKTYLKYLTSGIWI